VSNDVVRRDPFAGSFGPFRQAMDRFFEDPFFRTPFPVPSFNGLTGSDDGTLALDVYEKDNQLVVEASLPGYKKEDVDVQVHDGILSIKAQRSSETEEGEPGGKFYRRERSWGSVSRRIALPGVVKDATVEAELKNGVLKLAIPLPEKATPKQIEIKGE
jgi:HSP20 family protein